MKKSLSALAVLSSIAAIGFTTIEFTTQSACAQEYAPGQGVEVDISGINNWEAGTVIPFLPGDSQDGYQVRVKVPRYSLYPDGFMVQKILMRPGAAPADFIVFASPPVVALQHWLTTMLASESTPRAMANGSRPLLSKKEV